jgi:replicative DNA helicase
MAQEKKPIDLVTADAFGLDVSLLINACKYADSPLFVKNYAEIVREHSNRRRFSWLLRDFYEKAGDRMSDAVALAGELKAKLSDIGTSKRHEWLTAQSVAMNTYKLLEEKAKQGNGVKSGIVDLDRLLGGFFPGELTIIGAQPGAGKSVIGMLIALNAAKAGKKSGLLSLEMADTQYGQRLFSHLSGVDGMKMRKGELQDDDWPRILEAMQELSHLDTAFTFAIRYVEDFIAAVADKPLDIIIVDYIQLLRTRQRIDTERLIIGHISWQLKALSVDKRVPVIALAQLRRPEQGANKMPTMRDLRESSNLESDADGIILLYQPENERDPSVFSEHKDAFKRWREQGLIYTVLKVEKQRNGAVGQIPLLFNPSKMRYEGIAK